MKVSLISQPPLNFSIIIRLFGPPVKCCAAYLPRMVSNKHCRSHGSTWSNQGRGEGRGGGEEPLGEQLMHTPVQISRGMLGLSAVAALGVLWVRRRSRLPALLIVDPPEFERKRALLVKGGAACLQVIADFDRTLTAAFTDSGVISQSCHGMIEASPVVSREYHTQTQALFKLYYPIERSHTHTREEKIPLMKEWYERNHGLLLSQCSFTRPCLVPTVANANTQLRKGAHALMHALAVAGVPFLVFSAGVGDIIQAWLTQQLAPDGIPDNTHIISNWMDFDETGKLVGFKEPLIHMFNKDESHVVGTPFGTEVTGRRNVVLLGDSMGDVTMADGSEHDVVLRIGFLNAQMSELLESYKSVYDVLILYDGSMDFVNRLLREVVAGGKD